MLRTWRAPLGAGVISAVTIALGAACVVQNDRPLFEQPGTFPVTISIRIPYRSSAEDFPENVPTNVPVRLAVGDGFPRADTIDATTVRAVVGGAEVPSSVAYDSLLNEIVVTPAGACPDTGEMGCWPASTTIDVVAGPAILADGGRFGPGAPMADEARLPFATRADPDRTPPTLVSDPAVFSEFLSPENGLNTNGARPFVLRADIGRDDFEDESSPTADERDSELRFVAYVGPLPGAQDFTDPKRMVELGVEDATHRILGLEASREYWVVVRARDAAGNESVNLDDQVAMTGVSILGSETPTWSLAYGPVACERCLDCHATDAPPLGYYMPIPDAENDPYDWIVGPPSAELPTMRLIEPGNAAASYLVNKYLGRDCAPGIFGVQPYGYLMPAALESPFATCADAVNAIPFALLEWIDTGAPHNDTFPTPAPGRDGCNRTM